MEKENLLDQAKSHCLNKYTDELDIIDDLARIKHIKKLISRLKKGVINERLIINHIIILYNVFSPSFVSHLLKSSFTMTDWPYINTFLLYINRSTDFISINDELLKYLKQKIGN